MNPDLRSQGGDVQANGNPQPTPQPNAQPTTPSQPQSQQAAAADVLRSQISGLYGGEPVATPHHDQSVYDRTHEANIQPHAEQWKQYHSAWQDYYQKYYHAYYTQQKQTAQPAQPQAEQKTDGYFSHQTDLERTTAELNRDQALGELRNNLLGKIQASAKKARKSRHFIPIAAGVIVILMFVFVQYNSVLIATVHAYVSPGAINPQNIVIDPTNNATVGPEPRLIIPKINVDVPVIYDIGNDHASQMAAMEKGVAHFAIPGASSKPGQIGNTAISGHSSNDLFDSGDYKFIFAQLDKLQAGDTIYANYEGKRYTYVVTKKEVVTPKEVSKLVYPTDKPVLTLITCTPLGTALNRLLVTAEQVSPDPAAAAPSQQVESGNDAAMPGSAPTLFEKLFGAR